ncbi:MAG: hypothetical protein QOH62_2291 [Solirubrobacteraceae bacterium]|jgi:hypothetical protein|nr:hypothetical protein [Solirubrobacteraceae bacterium]
MRRLLPALLVLVAAGCGSATESSNLVGLPAGEVACRLAKEGASYRLGSGPVVKPSREVACQPGNASEVRVVKAVRRGRVVVLTTRCAPTVGCL